MDCHLMVVVNNAEGHVDFKKKKPKKPKKPPKACLKKIKASHNTSGWISFGW